MKIKKGDTVQMTVGKDAGKSGKVLRAKPDIRQVLVEGLNVLKHNRKPRKQGEKGEIISSPRFVSVANVMLVCPKCGKTARVGYKELKDGSKVRVCKKCAAEIK